MIIFGGNSSDGVLDLGEGTGPVEITRCMQYRLIKGGPREIRPNGHNIYTRHLEMPKGAVFGRWAEIESRINETRLRTQVTFIRQNFRSEDPMHTICDAVDVLLGKGIDEPVLHETIAAVRKKWQDNDGAEGDTVREVCDALKRLLLHRLSGRER